MKKILGLAAAFSVFSATPAGVHASVDNPYTFVVGTSAFNICFIRYGYLTSEEAVEMLYKLAAENGISRFQVANIVRSTSFAEEVDSATKLLGGCNTIIADFKRSLKRSKRSFAGKSLPTEIYYGVDPAKTFGGLNELSPNL